MKKLKLSSFAFNQGEVLNRAQLREVVGGSGVCYTDEQCGPYGRCEGFFCEYDYGGSGNATCQDGNNGGCPLGTVCIIGLNGISCI